MNRASIRYPFGARFKAQEDSQTDWLRRGMPRGQIPRRMSMILHLNIKGLNNECVQRHAMPVSYLRKLSGLEVSKPTFFRSGMGNDTVFGEYNLMVLLIGNKTRLGTVTQVRNGYCSDIQLLRLCVRSRTSRKHEFAKYSRKESKYSTYYVKYFNFSAEGELSDTEKLEIAIQGSVLMMMRDQIARRSYNFEQQERLANLLQTRASTFRTSPSCWKRNTGKVCGAHGRKPLQLTFWV